MNTHETVTTAQFEQLKELVRDIPYAMLTTLDEQGDLRSRPMATQEIDEEGNLWFFTGQSSPKVEEVQVFRQVNVVYSSGDNRFVSVSGDAEVIRDRKKMEELWKPTLKLWFPDGLEDPEMVLLRVKPMKAEYWDSSSNKFIQLFNMASALLAGVPYQGEGTVHQKVDVA